MTNKRTMHTNQPSMYYGEILCPRCGDDGSGNRYAVCAEGFTHEESCAKYTYGNDVCATCTSELGWKATA